MLRHIFLENMLIIETCKKLIFKPLDFNILLETRRTDKAVLKFINIKLKVFLKKAKLKICTHQQDLSIRLSHPYIIKYHILKHANNLSL